MLSFFAWQLVGGPLGLRGHAEKNLHIFFGQCAARKDAANAQHHVVGGVGGHEADVQQRLPPFGKHRFAHGGRGFQRALLRRLEGAGDHEKFVGANHDGHGHIQGFVIFGGRDADELGTQREVVQGQAVVFRAEQDGDGGVLRRLEEARRPLVRRFGVLAVESAAIGGSGDQAAIGDGFGDGGEFFAVLEDVACVTSHCRGVVHVHAGAGIHEH